MPISRNQGKRRNDTRRTVTWERDALALDGFHERVLRSAIADRSNSQSDFCGKVPLFLERVTYRNLVLFRTLFNFVRCRPYEN